MEGIKEKKTCSESLYKILEKNANQQQLGQTFIEDNLIYFKTCKPLMKKIEGGSKSSAPPRKKSVGFSRGLDSSIQVTIMAAGGTGRGMFLAPCKTSADAGGRRCVSLRAKEFPWTYSPDEGGSLSCARGVLNLGGCLPGQPIVLLPSGGQLSKDCSCKTCPRTGLPLIPPSCMQDGLWTIAGQPSRGRRWVVVEKH